MKKNPILGVALALVMLGNSCKNDDYRNVDPNADKQVQFTSSIAGNVTTRVTGNAWDGNDAIGVFMKQGNGLASPLAANKKYTTGGNGNFSADGAEVINYPESGTVDFIAYYPYTASVSGSTLPVSVADQSNQAAIDVLYSNNATGLTKTSPVANLNFVHKLSKVELTVKAGTGVANVNNLQVVYKNLNTTSSIDLATGFLGANSNSKDITAKTKALTGAQLVETILLPGDFSAKEVVFTVDGKNYTWQLPANTSFEAGKKYTYDIVLQTSPTGGNEVAVVGAGTITDWNTVPKGSVNLGQDDEQGGTDPGTNPGTGTEQTIYFEDFGTEGPISNPRTRIGDYKGYKEKTVTYADFDMANYADIRSTTTLNNAGTGTHIWLPGTTGLARTTGAKISGINTDGFSNLILSYDLGGASALSSTVKVKVNGVAMSADEVKLDASDAKFTNLVISNIPAAKSLEIEFTYAATTGTGFRLDNIKVVGTK